MSYLGFPRLHFSGRFQADPSTINNDPVHFNDARFTPGDQLPGSGATHGWWNPVGTGYWRFRDCLVHSVCYRDGTFCAERNFEPVVGLALNEMRTQVGGKLVDLDPEQQTVSEIWGFQIHLGDISQPNGFRSDFDVAPFSDIWVRYPQGHSDSWFSAVYQSVLCNIQWSQEITSRFLKELAMDGKRATRLSIKFTVDGYDDDRDSPEFTFGRVVGAIGPYQEDEPRHFVAGRLLRRLPKQPLNNAPCRIDHDRRLLLVDLGNSLPTTAAGGPLTDLGVLQMALLPTKKDPILIGPIDYLAPDWYTGRAGIQAFRLTPDQLELAPHTPLAVVKTVNDKVEAVYLSENDAGAFARADDIVFRLNPGDKATTQLYATKFGHPQPDQRFDLCFDNSNVQGQVQQGLLPGPPAGTPESALIFPHTITTDHQGKATIELSAYAPGNPRGYIDGQVYGVRYDWFGIDEKDYNNPDPSQNPTYLLNALVWDEYAYQAPPTWIDNVQPIFQQYANLYPVMKGIVDLSDYLSVVRRINALKLAFSRDVTDPNYMPVTRDLSTPKLEMIRTWLENPLYMKIEDMEGLKRALQLAIELEHATIPTYLCALYSIKPGHNQEVAEIIRSVVVEEMLHMSLACNLLNAIGGSPQINTPEFAPRFPGKLPGGIRPDLTVSLKRCSIDHIRDVFMAIEEPEETIELEGDHIQHHSLTIGWFYNEIREALEAVSHNGRNDIFVGDPDRQLREWQHTGTMIPVTDLKSAQNAIHEIVVQGEGASPLDPEDEYAELAHYYRFEEIVRGRRIVLHKDGYSFTGAEISFDPAGVWPMIDNPDTKSLPVGSKVRILSEEFNQTYANVLNALHNVFNGHPEGLPAAVGLMFSTSLQAQKLMQTPVYPDASNTAGPSFQTPT